ncbi:hypothetical protein TD95_000881 [Thielaviopsis punctulata]|uniref:Bromodomain associated domain-containing protein n=1 Tax=Thielaviopsis punctulata TaxID=72032 RepID=A0A0F4ZA72_9PEZI|nr:hypothetical protein TD95_000881 [Thielaviopsis punctulata]
MSAAPPTFFHALLRPCVLQILRATGYYGSRPTVIDTLTDLAVRYMYMLCQKTALHAVDNGHDMTPSVVDVRMALQDMGALIPERPLFEQDFMGEEDVRGVEEFIAWFDSPRYKAIMALPLFDGDTEAPDYLTALKTKHSKTGEDSKYVATALGRSIDHGEIIAEGGGEDLSSIQKWEEKIRGPSVQRLNFASPCSSHTVDSRPPSSQLSSVGDQVEPDVDTEVS